MLRYLLLRITRFIPICIFVTLFFINLFYPKLQFFATPDFGQSDLWMFNFPLKYFLSNSLKENSLPLWTHNLGNGFPLFAESQIGALNPFNLIFYKFLPFSWAFNLMYPLIFITSAIGTYLFCRLNHLSYHSSIFTSIIFSFSGFFITHITHPNLIQTSSLLPWLFLFTQKLYKKPTILNYISLSITVALSFLSGFAQITFIEFIGIFFYFIFLVIQDIFQRSKTQISYKTIIMRFARLIMAILMGICISAAQIIPTLEFLKYSQRINGFSLDQATYYSYPLVHLLTLLDPFALGNPAKGTYPHFARFDGSIFWENTAYIGIIPIIFVILSIFIYKKNRLIIFYWILLIVGLLLMLGKYSPINKIYSLPLFSLFHVPSRFILIFIWASSILAGIYINHIEIIIKRRSLVVSNLLISLIILFSFINIFLTWKSYHALIPTEDLFSPPETSLLLNGKEGRLFSLTFGYDWNNILLSEGWQDIKPYLYFRNSLRQNINLLYDKPQTTVYAGSNLERLATYNSLIFSGIQQKENDNIILSNSSVKLLKLQQVKYIITNSLVDNNQLTQMKTIQDKKFKDSNYYIYKQAPFEKAYIVYDKTIVKQSDLPKFLLNEKFNPQKTVALEKEDNKKISKSIAIPPKVILVKDTDNSVELRVRNNSSNGYLILADTYYPGWEAYVDGNKTELLPANLTQRAIFLPSGSHTINFKYKPLSFLIGGIITILSIIFMLTISLLKKPKNLFKDKDAD